LGVIETAQRVPARKRATLATRDAGLRRFAPHGTPHLIPIRRRLAGKGLTRDPVAWPHRWCALDA
jgi:hypothetical protein